MNTEEISRMEAELAEYIEEKQRKFDLYREKLSRRLLLFGLICPSLILAVFLVKEFLF